MDIQKQIEVMQAYADGKEIYYKSPYDDLYTNWHKVGKDHTFDFNNSYSIGEPKTWQEALAEDPVPTRALGKYISYLHRNGYIYDSTFPDGSHREMVALRDIHQIWNIGVTYGKVNPDAKLIEDSLYK